MGWTHGDLPCLLEPLHGLTVPTAKETAMIMSTLAANSSCSSYQVNLSSAYQVDMIDVVEPRKSNVTCGMLADAFVARPTLDLNG